MRTSDKSDRDAAGGAVFAPRHDGGASTPLVSVLLPARDAEQTLGACLRSLQRQSETRWECLLVDDGSRDATTLLAHGFAAHDARLHVVSTPRVGLVGALTTGLGRCRGRYVARMDADDVMHRTRLAAQVAALEQAPHLAAVGSHVRLFPRRDLSEGQRAYERWLNGIDTAGLRAEAFVECPIAHPSLMIRRDVLQAFGYHDRGWPEDYDLVLRLLAAGHAIGVVPRRLLGWRDGAARLSRTDAAYGLDRFTACKAAFLAASFLASVDRYVLWGYGSTGKALARALATHDKRPSHVVEVHPGRLGQRIHDAPVVSPDALPALAGRPIVVSVAGPQPRAEIRAALATMEFREIRDFVCAA